MHAQTMAVERGIRMSRRLGGWRSNPTGNHRSRPNQRRFLAKQIKSEEQRFPLSRSVRTSSWLWGPDSTPFRLIKYVADILQPTTTITDERRK